MYYNTQIEIFGTSSFLELEHESIENMLLQKSIDPQMVGVCKRVTVAGTTYELGKLIALSVLPENDKKFAKILNILHFGSKSTEVLFICSVCQTKYLRHKNCFQILTMSSDKLLVSVPELHDYMPLSVYTLNGIDYTVLNHALLDLTLQHV